MIKINSSQKTTYDILYNLRDNVNKNWLARANNAYY